MLGTLNLRGRNALSEFRTRKLNDLLAAARLDLAGLSAEYRHFVSVTRELTGAEREVLERILSYGPAAGEIPETGHLQLVVPRPGTISPWSSKATDIARQCGLDCLERIERGTAYYASKADGTRLTVCASRFNIRRLPGRRK